jgi:hypothetical protein
MLQEEEEEDHHDAFGTSNDHHDAFALIQYVCAPVFTHLPCTAWNESHALNIPQPLCVRYLVCQRHVEVVAKVFGCRLLSGNNQEPPQSLPLYVPVCTNEDHTWQIQEPWLKDDDAVAEEDEEEEEVFYQLSSTAYLHKVTSVLSFQLRNVTGHAERTRKPSREK